MEEWNRFERCDYSTCFAGPSYYFTLAGVVFQRGDGGVGERGVPGGRKIYVTLFLFICPSLIGIAKGNARTRRARQNLHLAYRSREQEREARWRRICF